MSSKVASRKKKKCSWTIYTSNITLGNYINRHKLLCVSKHVPPFACYNFDKRKRILVFFHKNVTNKTRNQKTLYCATLRNLCFCTTWQNWETRKSYFSLKCCITGTALPQFNQSLLDFVNLFDSRLKLTLLYDSLNLVTNAFISGLLGIWGMAQKKGSRKRHSNWTVFHTQCMCTNALTS